MGEMQDPGRRRRVSRKMSPGVEKATRVAPDLETLSVRLLPEEPQRISMDEFRQMLMTAVLSGASDITFQTDQQPRPEINGILYRGMSRPLSPTELNMVLMEAYGGSNGPTEINGRNVLDFSYELVLPDGGRQRFRVNATGIYGRDGAGVELTFRALPSRTPDLEMVRLGPDEVEALTPRDGIVVIAGATGSGKSTTMAALTRHHLEESPRPVKIIDVQAPIEYTFRDVLSSQEGSSSHSRPVGGEPSYPKLRGRGAFDRRRAHLLEPSRSGEASADARSASGAEAGHPPQGPVDLRLPGRGFRVRRLRSASADQRAGRGLTVLTLVVARARSGAIGRGRRIPWHAPEDLRAFRKATFGGAVIMGRRTWESLPARPLDGRLNLVITRDRSPYAHAFPEIGRALSFCRESGHHRVYGIGGEGICRALLPRADRLLVTEVDMEVPDADAFFPDFPEEEWRVVRRETLRTEDPACELRELLRKDPARSRGPI